MILLISPAKTLDFSESGVSAYSEPRLLDDSKKLVSILRRKSAGDLKQLMSISDRLAELNAERYQRFETPFTPDNAKPALLAFKGDVYAGMKADAFSDEDLAFAQDHLRILSGLYGLLRPLDLMQAYRLEMGAKLSNGHGKNLYEFWNGKITDLINADLAQQNDNVVVDLASREYFRAVDPDRLQGRLLQVQFKEWRDDRYRIISFNAKKARGMMCRYVIHNRIQDPEALKGFDEDGYFFNEDLSSGNEWVFVR